jgi:hypothetical protein
MGRAAREAAVSTSPRLVANACRGRGGGRARTYLRRGRGGGVSRATEIRTVWGVGDAGGRSLYRGRRRRAEPALLGTELVRIDTCLLYAVLTTTMVLDVLSGT